jgi:HSP20 family protein
MTLLRVYNSNGHETANRNSDYRFSDIMRDFFNEDVLSGYSRPKVNIAEENESYTLYMALPGIEKSEIAINFENDVLTISRKVEESRENRNFTRKEFDFGSFERSFNLPETVNVEKIDASMENGILKVVLPKKDEAIDRGPVSIKIS